MDNQSNMANTMRVKWADLHILDSGENKQIDFAKVIKILDKVAKKQLSQNLAKGLAKDYFFKAGLCYLANQDLTGLKGALSDYACEDPSFETDRKYKFLDKLHEVCEMRDRELFGQLVAGYQKITPFDKVQTKLVVKIKMAYAPEPKGIDITEPEKNLDDILVGGQDSIHPDS